MGIIVVLLSSIVLLLQNSSNLLCFLDSTQSTVNNNSETITSDSAAVTFWERKCHKMLIAQHSALIREILIKAWNEIDKLPIGEGTEILDDSYHAS